MVKIDMESFRAECVVSPMRIFKDGYYEVKELVGWRNKILILPAQSDRKWVIYDKDRENLEYGNFCRESCQFVGAVLVVDKLILLPLHANDPVVIVNLREMKVVSRQYLQNSDFIPDSKMEIWNAKSGRSKICFLIRGTSFFGDIRKQELHIVKIHAPEPLWCADFCENGGWALGNQGEYLYQFDEKGNLLNCFSTGLKMEMVRVLVKPKGIFLFSAKEPGIWVFDRDSKQTQKVSIAMEGDDMAFPPDSGIPDYWDYVETGQEIWFLPAQYRSPLLMINADTFINQQKIITYNERFSQKEYHNYYNYVKYIGRLKEQIPFYEDLYWDFNGYLEFIKNNACVSDQDKTFCGEQIWKELYRR